MPEAQPSFDRETWNALVQINADIATAASYLAQFGQQYVDDLANSYLAIGEKRYLAAIVAKIQRQAEDEAHGAIVQSSKSTAKPRCEPEFDLARWSALASEDPDIAAAMAEVGRYGRYYAADLAASYQVLDDKRYLRRIVDTIVTEAHADLANKCRIGFISHSGRPNGQQSENWEQSRV